MPIFVGFSTQEVNQPRTIETTGAFGGPGTTQVQPRLTKKFRLTDQNLIIRDLINAFSIKQGDKVGQPTYGTSLWGYLFEPNHGDVRDLMETEIRRVVAQDTRVTLNSLAIYPQDNGILFEMQIAYDPFDDATTLTLQLDKNTGLVNQVA